VETVTGATLRAMADHKAVIRWSHTGGDFVRGTYSREHTWSFDGGIVVPASPSPSVVARPYSNEAAVDPEEAFVAAIASCHMLSFLYVASKAGVEVRSYDDDAVGRMTKNERGVAWISSVVLRPRITYGAAPPSREQEDHLHHEAHEACFIANSVRTDIRVEKPQ
jgi:organic hydroperoxide reductase OsmC/OhrA